MTPLEKYTAATREYTRSLIEAGEGRSKTRALAIGVATIAIDAELEADKRRQQEWLDTWREMTALLDKVYK